jgi:hypothetical protein
MKDRGIVWNVPQETPPAMSETNAPWERAHFQYPHYADVVLVKQACLDYAAALVQKAKTEADSQSLDIECLCSEVERLKHLIFVWRQASYSGTPDEYQRAAVALEEEALRVSVVRAAEHRKHPTGDYCIFCRAQWPCEEALLLSARKVKR